MECNKSRNKTTRRMRELGIEEDPKSGGAGDPKMSMEYQARKEKRMRSLD